LRAGGEHPREPDAPVTAERDVQVVLDIKTSALDIRNS
jgi:hypothetical protein